MHNIVSGQMKDLIAISPKLFLAFGCIIYGGCRIVGIAVYDNEQLCLGAVKVGNEAKDTFLAAEPERVGSHEVKTKDDIRLHSWTVSWWQQGLCFPNLRVVGNRSCVVSPSLWIGV